MSPPHVLEVIDEGVVHTCLPSVQLEGEMVPALGWLSHDTAKNPVVYAICDLIGKIFVSPDLEPIAGILLRDFLVVQHIVICG
jgi:hypothetical protein